MKSKFLRACCLIAGSLGVSLSANAALVSVNGSSVEALNLNSGYASFEDFYDYNSSNRFSSNTGLEVPNTLVMFVAELDNEFGIFGIVSDFSGGSAGALNLGVSGTSGNLTFVEDPSDTVTASEVSFEYGADRTDGFIYSAFSSDIWTVNFDILESNGIAGIQFINFIVGELGNASYSPLLGLDETIQIASATTPSSVVSAPSSFSLMVLLGLVGWFRHSIRR